tara:strand:+ start:3623 stop:3886 length:264 start_codon:yes stop_codon:yes gene_type:complete
MNDQEQYVDSTQEKNNSLLVIDNKSNPLKKTNSFKKLYDEYLITSKDKNIEFSNSNFNPNDQNSPNVFVNKLENRIKLYYSHLNKIN